MMTFYNKQTTEQKEVYENLLSSLASLSKLFSSSDTPYLHYRAHEILFCYAFGANNISRGDVSFDATKDGVGIGLKTFLHGNGNTFQKIAEFNSVSDEIRELGSKHKDIAYFIADKRNERLSDTLSITNTNEMLYHVITRKNKILNIAECPMSFVNKARIKKVTLKKNNIYFKDSLHEYNFSLAKNTLYKKFDLSESIIHSIDANIMDNPFKLLDNLKVFDTKESTKTMEIVLPLYSTSTGDVGRSSGLNQWNASGRKRHEDEVYIPIPTWIHRQFPVFFNYRGKTTPSFMVKLPNESLIPFKVCQSGGKALMSNPNRLLGHWLLRDVLKLQAGQLATRQLLRQKDIDSVLVTKVEGKEYDYELDFLKYGSYERFEESHKE